MDLEAAADELYGVTPEEFVARRTALVAAARLESDRSHAREIARLRRPTRTAWLLNLLARAATERVGALLALAPALRDAQQRMDGTALRRLSAERRALVDALAKRAVQLGHEHGYQPPDAALREISETLQAALGDPEIAALLRSGRLVQAARYGGFGFSADHVPPASVAAESTADHLGAENGTDQQPPAEDDRAQAAIAARADADRAIDAANEARAAARAAQASADEATAAADDWADRVAALREELRAAEDAERAARDVARTARKSAARQRSELAAAEEAARVAAERVERQR